jgi:uncharacterized protein YcgI (DUF1989 family)
MTMSNTQQYGAVRYEEVLEPVTGRAVPVHFGETLHITQIEGPQCVDFNCFNLHDYKENMSVGHMRRTGFRAHKGSIIWSKPPRYSPMMVIAEIPPTCQTDLLAARCHATQFEKERGYPGTHTNCQDALAECLAEYGLTPDDVHDSLNFWMNTGWDDLGNFIPNTRRNTGRKGDRVVLLSLMDVLAVPNVCGSGDVSNTSNYWFQPIKIEIREATDWTRATAERIRAQNTGYVNQRKPDQFRVNTIKAERELTRNEGFKARFVNTPMEIQSFEIELDDQDWENIEMLIRRGAARNPEDAFRSGVMTWYTRNRTPQIAPEVFDAPEGPQE